MIETLPFPDFLEGLKAVKNGLDFDCDLDLNRRAKSCYTFTSRQLLFAESKLMLHPGSGSLPPSRRIAIKCLMNYFRLLPTS